MMTEDHSFKEANDDVIVSQQKGGGVADENLFRLLKEERKNWHINWNYPFCNFPRSVSGRYGTQISRFH